MGKNIILTESQFKSLIKEALSDVSSDGVKKDRHKDGYYDEYAIRTGKKDRHSPGYYKKYNEKKKEEKSKGSESKSAKKSDRRAYYKKYNMEHPERLNRGYTKGRMNDLPSLGIRTLLGYDEFGLPITNDPLGDMIRNHEMTSWHDDDWCEDVD